MSNEKKTYEEYQKRLEEIVEKLETEEVSLEEHVDLFKEAMTISKKADALLKEFEQNITVLLEENGETVAKEIDESELRE